MPRISAVTAINVVVARMMPSSVRKLRNLFLRSESSAMRVASQKDALNLNFFRSATSLWRRKKKGTSSGAIFDDPRDSYRTELGARVFGFAELFNFVDLAGTQMELHRSQHAARLFGRAHAYNRSRHGRMAQHPRNRHLAGGFSVPCADRLHQVLQLQVAAQVRLLEVQGAFAEVVFR